MRTIYLDCGMGAAGDMLMAALLELCPEKQEEFLGKMNGLGLPGVKVEAEPAVKCGITGTHMNVTVFGEEEESEDVHDHGHAHTHSHEACESAAADGLHSHVHSHDGHDHHHEDHDAHSHDHHHGEHVHSHDGHDHSHHHHHHSTMAGIASIIDGLDIPDPVKEDMKAVYALIAEAESHAHGMPVDQIHFHEVGTMDAVADIAGVCLLFHELGADQIIASPVHVGSGHVHCAHGILPVPAPATAHILQGIPAYSTQVQGELCTPTGAALLKHFVKEFREMPVMTTSKIGYGMGKKDFERANCVRAFWGESGAPQQAEIVELCCHIDDMTAEALAFAGEQLLAQGALDISCAPLTMKKGRAGVSFTVLCKPRDEGRIAHAILRETTTNGVRTRRCGKYILTPSVKTVETAYGPIRVKCADGEGIHRKKPEYEDVASAARTAGLPFQKVWEDVLSAIRGEVSQNG